MKDDYWWMILYVVLLMLGVALLGYGAGSGAAINDWQQEAIAHGCAAYDQTTGEWGWLQVTRETE